jgi:hypothetical protein
LGLGSEHSTLNSGWEAEIRARRSDRGKTTHRPACTLRGAKALLAASNTQESNERGPNSRNKMLIPIALVTESASVSPADLMQVSAALQKQVVRDFRPIWEVEATIDPFSDLDDVPVGYWPVIVVDQVSSGDVGIHGQRDGQPIAFVKSGPDWSFTASHECLEMLADPWGRRLVPGDSLAGDGQRVEYLVEVCDPCQHTNFGYRVNGWPVADFYTPNYFDPSGSSAARYDFTGAISEPRQILEGGYLSWRDPVTDRLHRADRIDGVLWASDLGVVPATAVSLRSVMDSKPEGGKRIGRIRLASNKVRRRMDKSHYGRAAAARRKRLAEQFSSLSGIKRK